MSDKKKNNMKAMTRQEVLDTIHENLSLEPLTKKYSRSLVTIMNYARRLGISPHKEIKKAKILNALEQGVDSTLGLYTATGYNYKTLAYYVKEYKIRLPFKIERVITKRSPRLDLLIRKGFSQSEMGRLTGNWRQEIHEYVKRTNQLDIQKKRYQEACYAHHYLREKLYVHMYERMLQMGKEEGFATETALHFCITPRLNRRKLKRFDTLKKLYANYEQAVLNNEKPPLSELIDNTGIGWPSGASRLISAAGLKPFHEQGEKTEKWRIAIRRKRK